MGSFLKIGTAPTYVAADSSVGHSTVLVTVQAGTVRYGDFATVAGGGGSSVAVGSSVSLSQGSWFVGVDGLLLVEESPVLVLHMAPGETLIDGQPPVFDVATGLFRSGRAGEIPLVAGVVSDSSFPFTPRNGQEAIDTVNQRRYTRTGGAWLSVALNASATLLPDNISGLKGWYDASRSPAPGTVDGDAIAQWNDLVTTRHLLQGTAGSKPLYKTAIQNGKAVARFDGVDDFLFCSIAAGTCTTTSASASITVVTTTSGLWEVGQEIAGTGIPAGTRIGSISGTTFTLVATDGITPVNATASGTGVAITGAIPQPFTIFAVVRASLGATADEQILDGGNGIQLQGNSSSGGRYVIFASGSQVIQAPKDNTMRVITAVANGNTSVIRNNGVQNTGILTTGLSLRDLRLGRSSSSLRPLNGDIATFGWYNRALTAGELDLLDQILGGA